MKARGAQRKGGGAKLVGHHSSLPTIRQPLPVSMFEVTHVGKNPLLKREPTPICTLYRAHNRQYPSRLGRKARKGLGSWKCQASVDASKTSEKVPLWFHNQWACCVRVWNMAWLDYRIYISLLFQREELRCVAWYVLFQLSVATLISAQPSQEWKSDGVCTSLYCVAEFVCPFTKIEFRGNLDDCQCLNKQTMCSFWTWEL